MNERKNSITIWRIIFCYMIMIYHFDNKYNLSWSLGFAAGWYIGVEFFFIVSGYLMYRKIDALAQKYPSGPSYYWMRYKRIYPYYLASLTLSLIFLILRDKLFSVTEILRILSNDFFEFFCLQSIGLNDGWNCLNNTLWFLSTLLICSFIIYHCLVKWRETFVKFAAPIIVMISFSFLYRNLQSIGSTVQVTNFYENWPLMRGMADMCLGIFAAELTKTIEKKYAQKKLIRAAGVCGFLFVILCSMKYGMSTADFLYAMILTVSVAIGFLPSGLKMLEWKWVQGWADLTLYMYLTHDLFRTFIFPEYMNVTYDFSNKMMYLLLYLVMVTVFSMVFYKVVSVIVKGCGRLLKAYEQ